MPTHKKKSNFFDSPAGMKAKELLTAMVADSTYKTDAYFSANTTLHPNNQITFVEKHMEYLRNHQTVNPDQYISNLRLMTRIKRFS